MTTLTLDTMTHEQIAVSDRELNVESNKFGKWFRSEGEDLNAVALKDKETLGRLGLTYEQVADRINELFKKHKIGELVEERYSMCQILMRLGSCPFIKRDYREGCEHEVKDRVCVYAIHDNVTGKDLMIPSIWADLIKDHHCLGGEGSKFRLDPVKAYEVLFVSQETHDVMRKLAAVKV
jgi:hypothetical protein